MVYAGLEHVNPDFPSRVPSFEQVLNKAGLSRRNRLRYTSLRRPTDEMVQCDRQVHPDSAPSLRATRRVNLALLSAAVLSRRKLSLSALARVLPVSLSPAHHQRKKRLSRFLSNDKFDPVHVQTEMMAHIISMAGLRGLTPIMIDWSDLGRGFNGLFAAVCFRRRGLPLMSWVVASPRVDSLPKPHRGVLHSSAAHPYARHGPSPATRSQGIRSCKSAQLPPTASPSHRLQGGLWCSSQGRCHNSGRHIQGQTARPPSAQASLSLHQGSAVSPGPGRLHQYGVVLGEWTQGAVVLGHLVV